MNGLVTNFCSLFCLYQWFVVYYLHSTRFTKTEMREGYRRIRKIDPPKDETGIEL